MYVKISLQWLSTSGRRATQGAKIKIPKPDTCRVQRNKELSSHTQIPRGAGQHSAESGKSKAINRQEKREKRRKGIGKGRGGEEGGSRERWAGSPAPLCNSLENISGLFLCSHFGEQRGGYDVDLRVRRILNAEGESLLLLYRRERDEL